MRRRLLFLSIIAVIYTHTLGNEITIRESGILFFCACIVVVRRTGDVGLLSSRIGKIYIHLSETLGDVFREIFVFVLSWCFADRILYISIPSSSTSSSLEPPPPPYPSKWLSLLFVFIIITGRRRYDWTNWSSKVYRSPPSWGGGEDGAVVEDAFSYSKYSPSPSRRR